MSNSTFSGVNPRVTDGILENSYLIIFVVGSNPPQIPLDTATTQHDTGEAVIHSLFGGDDTDTDGPLFPDSVSSHDLLDLIHSSRELGRPLVDIFQQPVGEVKCNTTRSNVRGVEASTGDTLVEFHELLALFETPQEWGQRADVHGVGENGHQVYPYKQS